MKRVICIILLSGMAAGCGSVAENLAEQAAERALEAEGGGSVDIDLDDDGGSVQIQTEDGEITIDAGGGELPEELTIPVPDRGTVSASQVQTSPEGSFVVVTMLFPSSMWDELIAFYRDYFDGKDAVLNESSGSGAETVVWTTGDYTTSVNISKFDGDDFIGVGITQQGG